MFIVRNALLSDLDDLFNLSKQALLLNLPRDKKVIESKVKESISSFDNPDLNNIENNHFIFCLEDISKKKVVGVSMIHGQHGTQSKPHFFLKVGHEERSSETLNKNYQHETLKFGHEPNGYTEIGGLVLDKDYRGHPQKLGKLLSLTRFIFIGENKNLFTKQIHSELMPPLTSEGSSLLWEAIGRKFFKMEYWEADKLSQTNKEFILNLFPQGTIYTKLLPDAARESIGMVGNDTLPVKKMLENIGFRYTHEVDPFDGGPHYRADVEEISIIKNSLTFTPQLSSEISKHNSISGFSTDGDIKFICTYSEANIETKKCFVNEKLASKLLSIPKKSRTYFL